MRSEPVVNLIAKPVYSSFFVGVVHVVNLSIGPGVDQSMVEFISSTKSIKGRT
jgi:hypothetical protein